jgi:DnaK suppressor protein
MDGLLLQTIEGLGDAPMVSAGCEIWKRLQSEKEQVSQKILSQGSLCHPPEGILESEASEEYGREVEWRHRGQLEARLREINDAQDRLMDGVYGFCTDCGAEIGRSRLAADAAASLCVACKQLTEAVIVPQTM